MQIVEDHAGAEHQVTRQGLALGVGGILGVQVRRAFLDGGAHGGGHLGGDGFGGFVILQMVQPFQDGGEVGHAAALVQAVALRQVEHVLGGNAREGGPGDAEIADLAGMATVKPIGQGLAPGIEFDAVAHAAALEFAVMAERQEIGLEQLQRQGQGPGMAHGRGGAEQAAQGLAIAEFAARQQALHLGPGQLAGDFGRLAPFLPDFQDGGGGGGIDQAGGVQRRGLDLDAGGADGVVDHHPQHRPGEIRILLQVAGLLANGQAAQTHGLGAGIALAAGLALAIRAGGLVIGQHAAGLLTTQRPRRRQGTDEAISQGGGIRHHRKPPCGNGAPCGRDRRRAAWRRDRGP